MREKENACGKEGREEGKEDNFYTEKDMREGKGRKGRRYERRKGKGKEGK